MPSEASIEINIKLIVNKKQKHSDEKLQLLVLCGLVVFYLNDPTVEYL